MLFFISSLSRGDSDLETKAAVQEIENLLGDKAVYAGLAVQSKTVEEQVSGQMGFILGLGITFIFLILLLMTNSYGEPILFLLTILVAVGLNRGTNVFLGKFPLSRTMWRRFYRLPYPWTMPFSSCTPLNLVFPREWRRKKP